MMIKNSYSLRVSFGKFCFNDGVCQEEDDFGILFISLRDIFVIGLTRMENSHSTGADLTEE
jgi:hypothetical protein